jgi:hypothetical protein
MSKLAAIAMALALLVSTGEPAVAAAPQAAPEAGVPERAVRERLRFIEERLDSHRLHANLWYWGWMTVFVGSTPYNAIGAATTDHGADRANYIAQGVLSLGGIGDLLFRPFDARFGADPVRALPGATPEERRQQLERAEALLRANAERAETRTSWLHHLANAAANGVAGLVVWAAGDGKLGAISAATGTAVGEVQIWTEPGGPVQDLKDYQRFKAGHPAEAAGGWSIVPALGGVTVRYRF